MARGVFKIDVQADITGPIGDGTADRALQDWAKATAKALGDEGVKILRAWPMDKTGRAHGGFENALNATEESPGLVRIKGPQIAGVAWSPWLEGTSQRNRSTKFKGYGLFKKTQAQLDEAAPDVGQRELDRVLPRIGGTP
jgi:hypothetical protein